MRRGAKRSIARDGILACGVALALCAGAAPVEGGDASVPPEGDAVGPSKTCLANLRERRVDFMEWPTKGVRTPIRLVGSVLGPLRLVIRDHRPGGVMPTMDCELARALLEAAPIFQMAGIRDLSFSGIYQYRTRRGSTRLSEHAHGLAIDVHAFVTADGQVFDVEHDFEPGVGDWSTKDQLACVGAPEGPIGRLLRQLACGLRVSSAFREIITADDNADHKNHFHIEAFPDPLSRARAILSHREPTIDD
jgi:Extensin-like protein C-terminus